MKMVAEMVAGFESRAQLTTLCESDLTQQSSRKYKSAGDPKLIIPKGAA
jgi:hypothetical protein